MSASVPTLPSASTSATAPAVSRGQAPGPAPLPLVGWRGNALRFFRRPISYLMALRRDHGSVARLVAAPHPPLFVQSDEATGTYFGFGAEANREILTRLDDFTTLRPRGPKTEAFDRLSDNILFANGDEHDRQRRLLMPAFTRQHLENYHQDIVAYTAATLEGWRQGEPFDLQRAMSGLALDIASKTLFGLEPVPGSHSLAASMRRMIDTMFSPAAMVPIDLPATPYGRLRRDMESIGEDLRAEIERKRAVGLDGTDFLSMMIARRDDAGGGLSDRELVSQAFVMFFAGHDTSSAALSWSLFLLSQHPDATHELLDELDRELGGGPPSYRQLFTLPVLDRTVKECLRLLGPAVMFPRITSRATTLGGYDLPAGAEVLYSSYVTHRDPSLWEEATRFRPRRWESAKPTAYEYLPFGGGARKCLGGTFGSMQLRIILPMVLQRWRLAAVPRTRIEPRVNVVMAPKALWVIAEPQDRRLERSVVPVTGPIREMVDLSA